MRQPARATISAHNPPRLRDPLKAAGGGCAPSNETRSYADASMKLAVPRGVRPHRCPEDPEPAPARPLRDAEQTNKQAAQLKEEQTVPPASTPMAPLPAESSR